ncbi:putative zinc metalloprotease [Actinoplanes ianthinogenes]|uniref:Zinc metalloprotease n=1 Tax=Actinoplanes ianthinogenes TaxID=122358 RepID=A0ABM7M5U5_9ACTN|nr:M50 family metallopeptidase [Actinoplanes ianthinogenes]BCJ47011.1 putative zinc metalloprotease [Actinoplanes ianthinogenes]GGR13953.1 putative zinc metalloprotease [Actinoplanes ianthinogenes]
MIWGLGAVIFLLGLMLSIALHEVGHFVPARRFGVKVTQWMVGFGPTAWSRRRGETEFGIKWIPVGGYIRMIGMLPPSPGTPPGKVRQWSTGPLRSMIDGAREAAWEEVGPGDQGRLFYQRPWWQRVIIMGGGPGMNVVLGFVFLSVALTGIGITTAQPVVQQVQACVLPAAAGRSACDPTVQVTPAAVAGLRPGDRIVSYDGAPIRSWTELTDRIRTDGGHRIMLTVERDGATLSVPLTLASVERDAQSVGFLGVQPTFARQRMSPAEVAGLAGTVSREVATSVFRLPERMAGIWRAAFSDAPRSVESPIGVVGATRLGGDVAAADLPVTDRVVIMLQLLASFNIAMGIFNLVPLLPLDGGHIAAALLEGLKRGVGRLFGRRLDRPVDVARTIPLTSAAALVMVAMAALLAYADLVNPIHFGS